MLACADAGGHQNPDDQAGLHGRAAKEAAAHIFGRSTSEDKTVHDIATPDVKQRIADTSAVLSADATQKALEVKVFRPVPLACKPLTLLPHLEVTWTFPGDCTCRSFMGILRPSLLLYPV